MLRRIAIRLLSAAAVVALFGSVATVKAVEPAPVVADEEAPPAKGVKGMLAKAAKLMDAKNYDEALDAYGDVLDMDENNVFAHTQRAWIFNEKGKFDAAIRECGKAIDLDDGNVIAFRERGYARLQKKMYEPAVKDFTKAIRLGEGTDYNPYVYRAQALRALDRDDEADADIAKAKKLGYKPKDSSGE
jgi:tetratricopeptide (TPR) repeat protein